MSWFGSPSLTHFVSHFARALGSRTDAFALAELE